VAQKILVKFMKALPRKERSVRWEGSVKQTKFEPGMKVSK